MNWFQRYGISGAYFIGLTIAWVYALYHYMVLSIFEKIDVNILIATVAILFGPIGYILFVFQQWLYLLCPGLGIHSAVKRGFNKKTCREDAKSKNDEDNVKKSKRDIRKDIRKKNKGLTELVVEPEMLLKTMKIEEVKNEIIYVREWIHKRMDVMAISATLSLATAISFAFAFIIPKYVFHWDYQFDIGTGVLLIVLSAIVLFVLIINYFALRNQLIKVTAGIEDKIRNFDNIEQLM